MGFFRAFPRSVDLTEADLNASKREIKAARAWLRENYTEVDGWTIGQLGSRSIIHAVEREYDGGWVQFLLDTFPAQR